MSGHALASVELADLDGPPEHSSAVVQIKLLDGRQFSVLAATPSWFEQAFARLGLRYYFGHAVLFVRRMELPIARRAAEEMARRGDPWLCRYDTPRTTLAAVLEDFKKKHP